MEKLKQLWSDGRFAEAVGAAIEVVGAYPLWEALGFRPYRWSPRPEEADWTQIEDVINKALSNEIDQALCLIGCGAPWRLIKERLEGKRMAINDLLDRNLAYQAARIIQGADVVWLCEKLGIKPEVVTSDPSVEGVPWLRSATLLGKLANM